MNSAFWKQIEFFEPHEWQQDPTKASPDLVRALDRARKLAGVKILIHVCWAGDGHSESSYHYTGQAVDFHFGPGLPPAQEFAILAAQPEFGGIGYYPGWYPRPGWHVDLRDWSDGRLYWIRAEDVYRYGTRPLALTLRK